MEFCPECGTKNDDFARNCVNCGIVLNTQQPAKNLDQPAAPPEKKHIFCGECGAQNQVGARFCGECGHPIGGGMQTTMQSQHVEPQRYQQPSQPSYQAPQGYHTNTYQPSNQNYYRPGTLPPSFYHPDKKSTALAVIISIIIPGFAYMYTSQLGKGILYFFLTFFLYGFGIGIFFHAFMVYAGKRETDNYNWNLYQRSQGRGF